MCSIIIDRAIYRKSGHLRRYRKFQFWKTIEASRVDGTQFRYSGYTWRAHTHTDPIAVSNHRTFTSRCTLSPAKSELSLARRSHIINIDGMRV